MAKSRHSYFCMLAVATMLLLLLMSKQYSQHRLVQLKQPSRAWGSADTRNGLILSPYELSGYVNAIVTPNSTTLEHLECPAFNTLRYDDLKFTEPSAKQIEYFFPLNLRQNLSILPTLLNNIVEAILFLGPERCVLSIVEGNSPDGTAEVLDALRPGFAKLGINYHYRSTAIDPSDGDRIQKLAILRNAALQPMYESPHLMTESALVVFLNDVVACTEDILELILQLRHLNADMTCAMDWNPGSPPWFYDSWIARGINGDTFFEFPNDMSFSQAQNLFWNDPETKLRFKAHKPFQVFSCWNGGATFRAQPLLDGLRFRGPSPEKGECAQGEPQVFSKDLWLRGYGKIAVVPSVNFGYTNRDGHEIKKKKGFVSDLVAQDHARKDYIEWTGPPDYVKCVEPWSSQFWQAWNTTAAVHSA